MQRPFNLFPLRRKPPVAGFFCLYIRHCDASSRGNSQLGGKTGKAEKPTKIPVVVDGFRLASACLFPAFSPRCEFPLLRGNLCLTLGDFISSLSRGVRSRRVEAGRLRNMRAEKRPIFPAHKERRRRRGGGEETKYRSRVPSITILSGARTRDSRRGRDWMTGKRGVYGSTSAIHDPPIHDHNEREDRGETWRESSLAGPREGAAGRVGRGEERAHIDGIHGQSLFSYQHRWKRRGPIIWAVSCETQ